MLLLFLTVEQAAHQVAHQAAQVFQADQVRVALEARQLDPLLKAAQVVLQVMEMLAAQDHLVVD
jgi:16S rRNA C1402 N4-methylase RsmH